MGSDLQTFFDNLKKEWRLKRAESQMTLGKLISELEKVPSYRLIENIGEPHSYRGYYEDLAFEKEVGNRTVESLLSELKGVCLHNTFEGYKGGYFYMDIQTPLWIADYGSSGVEIVDIHDDGTTILFITKKDDD